MFHRIHQEKHGVSPCSYHLEEDFRNWSSPSFSMSTLLILRAWRGTWHNPKYPPRHGTASASFSYGTSRSWHVPLLKPHSLETSVPAIFQEIVLRDTLMSTSSKCEFWPVVSLGAKGFPTISICPCQGRRTRELLFPCLRKTSSHAVLHLK